MKASKTTESTTSKARLLTLEMIGSSNRISIDSTATNTSGGATTTAASSGKLSGTSFAEGAAVGFTGNPSARLGLEGNLAFFAKKIDASQTSAPTTQPVGKESIKLATLRATALARFYAFPWLSFGGGIYASEFIGGIQATDPNGERTITPFSEFGFNRFDYGAAVGARGEIGVAERVAFILDVRYFHGLANLVDEDRLREQTAGSGLGLSSTARTRDLQFGAGLGYRF